VARIVTPVMKETSAKFQISRSVVQGMPGKGKDMPREFEWGGLAGRIFFYRKTLF